jgi:ATP-dependent Clp protease ATP-binding subunit ClpA
MKFNNEIQVILNDSRSIAIDLGSDHISSFHFILALLKSDNFPNEIFKKKEWNFVALYKSMLKVEKKNCKKYYLTVEFEKAIKNATYYSWIYNVKEIKSEHVILALLTDKKSFAGAYLTSLGLDYIKFKTLYEKVKKQNANKLLELIGTNQLTIKLKIPNMVYNLFNKKYD